MNIDSYNIKIKNVCQQVNLKGERKTILSNVNIDVNKGEFVAIVGCSGAGKTSLMNILSCYTKPSKGNVFIEGLDLFKEEEYFKGKIAYVPQREILDTSLTLQKSLEYSLDLRVKNITKIKSQKIINEILEILELSHVKNNLIKTLSGGEKKRASIATEMLSNPSLFLLDEPTSGLDSNIEKKVMKKLREISNLGKTIIITAHTISNLHLCDKIIFMGQNGKICYYGTYEDIFKYFKVKEFVDIYDILKEDVDTWYKKFNSTIKNQNIEENNILKEKRENVGFFKQTKTLVKRYVSSLFNSKFMLFLLLGQALVMGILICLATERNSFLNSQSATMIGAAFTMAAMWLGLFNTVQEIVKERDILKKEYMSGLNYGSYIISKIVVISILCLYQAFVCVTIVYFYLDPRPEKILFYNTWLDLIINFFFVAFSTSIIGIVISSSVKDVKTTLILSPLYMMVQMLFSGMFIPFVNFTKFISYFVIGRWGYESFGTILNLSQYGVIGADDKFFRFNLNHITNIWFIFLLISIVFLIISIMVIKKSILAKKNHSINGI